MKEQVRRIEWWPIEKFKDRVTTVIRKGDTKVPDYEVVCDICNADVKRFPCPVLAGYALCPWCQQKHHISEGDNEYFEKMSFVVGDEEEIPGVTNGGRKRKELSR